MKKIDVNLKQNSYSIFVEKRIFNQIPKILKDKLDGQRWIIISQYNLMEIFGFKLLSKFKDQGFNVDYITTVNSENAKSMNEYNRIITQLFELGCDRSTVIIALGGGVIGDLAGFIASSFMRGVKYYQVPTTLLSMVDSSIGGKTGINIAEGKNLIGSIYQPSGVFIDPKLLNSLPKDEVVSGLGEVIKYGAIRDRKFLDKLSIWLDNMDEFPFEKAIEISVKIKAEIVSIDEKELGLRKILNFGHTIGHGLESTIGYGKIRHGEAVALGILCSSWISKKLGILSNQEYDYLVCIINKLNLPKVSQINHETLLSYINKDKKKRNGIIQFILLNKLGEPTIHRDISDSLILNSIKVLK
tara:strand:+ start:1004 stop:2074 length:1071 start_codon:yes stop_codon:yes gene_type:complete